MKQKINEIEIPDGKRAEWVNGVLTLVDDKPKDVTERIKTFEDACSELGGKHPFVIQYKKLYDCFLNDTAMNNSHDIIAFLKLRIITAALNEGWEPQFTDDEYRYYPWFYITKKNNMSECGLMASIEIPGMYRGDFPGTHAGFAYAFSNYAPSTTISDVGSRLCFKTQGLAIYAGKQFSDIWFDLCLIRK